MSRHLWALVAIAALAAPAVGHAQGEEPKEEKTDAPTVKELEHELKLLHEEIGRLRGTAPGEQPPPKHTEAPPPHKEKDELPLPPKKADEVRSISTFQPLRVTDAEPASSLEASVTTMTTTLEGEDGFFVMPAVTLGTPWDFEVQASTQVGVADGFRRTEAFSFSAMSRIVDEQGLRPSLALEAEVLTPHADSGLGANVGALATKSVGTFRVHGNALVEARHQGSPHWMAGVGIDRPLSENILLAADGWYQRTLGEQEVIAGAGVGSMVHLGKHLRAYGSVGLQRHADDFDPRFLLGIEATR